MRLPVDLGPCWAFGPFGRPGGPGCSAGIGGASFWVVPARESELRGLARRVWVGVEGRGEDGESVRELQSHGEEEQD